MSLIFENECGYFISHKDFLNKLYGIEKYQYLVNEDLFSIVNPYKKRKKQISVSENVCNKSEDKNRCQSIKQKYLKFLEYLKTKHLLISTSVETNNQTAQKFAEVVYTESGRVIVQNCVGFNNGTAKIQEINKSQFLFPENSEFFCKDICELKLHLKDRQFDVILLDPPWWNKYIRRKRKKSNDSYKMLYNSEFKNIPIEDFLKNDGLVVVWCTNSSQNLNELLNEIFPKWGVSLVATWFWVKITQTGAPVCDFSDPPGKQPYEKIIFGSRSLSLPLPEDGKLVLSIPSAIHSHKPPLTELLKAFLPEKPLCLEIFARYLLPNFTSYGNEVLRLQHVSLFTKTTK